ncbi:Hsp70 family protein [Roseimaritima ulvae]|uniref:Chaperone protein DnaK n=1 Tax=Roseimaritima ulvae TaxID=980254 RepID=A0A5B9QKV2_9BACT|nr:Hsp70 family protein [Roseimaritima ulvae]QEG38619.1 Chaperone protein DnaK [Roseimaritima ulvae]
MSNQPSATASNPQFSIGIDLGTTNSTVAFAPLDDPDCQPSLLPIPQIVQPGQIESLPSLPSFLYLPREGELESLQTPLGLDPQAGIAGVYARAQAADNPQRVVVAAKSWLCHSRQGRSEAILPWQAPAEVPRVSALDCTTRFLQHLVAAWQAAHPNAPLADQQVVLTVPASFDPAARELTRQAATTAGFPAEFVLLEEPQAAVYCWLSRQSDSWRRQLHAGDSMLVVDVGGGTTDLTLVTVAEAEGELVLERTAVGNHLLVGGDNMDLTLAHVVSQQLAAEGHELDPWQSVSLWHACREAKERLLSDDGPDEHTISVLGRGSSLIGGTISTTIRKPQAAEVLVDGFFPKCQLGERPQRQASSGFQDIGLPYESDPAITKQVAAFLTDHTGEQGLPSHLLVNGGVFRSQAIRDQLCQTVRDWCGDQLTEYADPQHLDHAVAVGAAYYGWTKNHGGVRIRGGTARSYYIGIETAGLAIPGMPRPLRALCVAPQGMEEGTQADVPGEPVGVVVGTPARFRFFSSTVRGDDQVGVNLDRWSPEELVESDPIELQLTSQNAGDEPFVPVRFHSRVTELGMFELWCHATRGEDQWKMEFNVRDEGEA